MRALRYLPLLALSAACSGETAPTAAKQVGPLGTSFAAVAEKVAVPRDLLLAIAAVEGGLEIPAERAIDPLLESEVTIPVAGPLHLRRGKLDTLKRGAELTGVSEIELRAHADLALEAGARVLAELGEKTGARPGDLESWAAALEEMSGYADPPHRKDYARRVFALLAEGASSLPARGGETLTIAPHVVSPRLLATIELPTIPAVIDNPLGADYAGAEWFPTSCSGKCSPDRGGNPVKFVLIHDTEGGWDASVATLQNDPGKSVHYIVGADGRLGQFVNETVTAWHAGNFYVNQRSVGIEHVGSYVKPYPEKEYAVSAKLVDYLIKKYSIAKDRAHIIGHDQVPNGSVIAESAAPCSASPKSCETGTTYGGSSNHRDPGDWEWCTYMARLGGECKCTDAYPLWNCSTDKTKAYRCAAGKVELAICDGAGGCETMATGTADVCHTKPSGAPDAGPPADTGSAPPPLDDTGISVIDTGTTGAPVDSGANLAQPPAADTAGGCGCSTTRTGESSSFAVAALLALGAIARSRRR